MKTKIIFPEKKITVNVWIEKYKELGYLAGTFLAHGLPMAIRSAGIKRTEYPKYYNIPEIPDPG